MCLAAICFVFHDNCSEAPKIAPLPIVIGTTSHPPTVSSCQALQLNDL